MAPETRYAKTPDGYYIAYQVVGEGPIDLVWQFDFFGNVDVVWEAPSSAKWLEGLASFSRLILHDRRGTGLSSRNVDPPNLETRVDDLRVVLDTVGSEQAVLVGAMEGGAPNAMFAAAAPERVRSMVWWGASARSLWAPDYPWGATEEYQAATREAIERSWGTEGFGRAFVEVEASVEHPISEGSVSNLGKVSRHTGTPDVGLQLEQIWNDTDVRNVLPSVRVPVLALWVRDGAYVDEVTYTASLFPQAELVLVPGTSESDAAVQDAALDAIRAFIGVDRAPMGLDTILSTVLFTDIVDSTQLQAIARRPRVEGTRAPAPRGRPRGVGTLARGRERHSGRRLLRHLRRPGSRDPLRAGGDGAGAPPRHPDPRRGAHRGVRSDRREVRGAQRLDRRPGGLQRRPVRGTRVPDGEGPRGGIRTRVRGRGRTRTEGCARAVALVSGGPMTLIPSVHYTKNGDFSLAYQVTGAGPKDLIYLPADAGNVVGNWFAPEHARFMEQLASFSRLVITDRRGMGCSDRLPPGIAPTLEELVDDLLVVMEQAMASPATILAGDESTLHRDDGGGDCTRTGSKA